MLAPAQSEDRLVTDPIGHRPVLLRETLSLLAPRAGSVFVDGTLGAGGHAEALLEAVAPTGRVIGIDRDPQAIVSARERLARFGDALVVVDGNHTRLKPLLARIGVETLDGALFDLGVSSMQLDRAERGFSFREDGPLDMRMDPRSGRTAADLVATLSETELAEILWTWGEERRSRAIARAIVRERQHRPIERTRQLAEIVERTLGPAARRFKIHPATRTFLGLRVAVNDELSGLRTLLEDAVDLLRPGGVVAVISFHSLEDRAIKHGLRALVDRCTCPPGLPVCGCGREPRIRVLTPRPVVATQDEIASNPRARSAKLRAGARL